MKKYHLFILLVFLPCVLFAEELQFQVMEKSKYVPFRIEEPVYYLEKGDIVICRNKIYYSQLTTVTGDFSYLLIIILKKDGEEYWTEAEKLKPLHTNDVFPPNIAINHSRKNNELWVPSYYADVLSSQNRDTLIGFESYWLPYEIIDDFTDKVLASWHMDYQLNHNAEVMFYNAAIRLTLMSYCLMVKDIQKTDYGYKVICIRSRSDIDKSDINSGSNFNWSYIKDDKYFSLLIKEDGDYLDLYVDNFSQKFGAVIKVKQEFAKQFESLIKTDTCDLTNVQWPRRADGSMDYTLPNTSDNTPNRQSIEEINDDEPYEGINAKNDAERHFIPLWALAVIGGTVAVGGCAAFFIIKRKK
jgi:hypothetical protein